MKFFRRKSLKEKYNEKLRASIYNVHKKWKNYERVEKMALSEDQTLGMQMKLQEKKYRFLLREIRRREL